MNFKNKINRFSIKLTKQIYIKLSVIILSLSILIIIIGYIKSYNDVKFPYNELPIFSNTPYLPASKIRPDKYYIIDEKYFENILRKVLKNNSPSIETFQQEISSSLFNKKVLLQKISFAKNKKVEALFNDYSKKIKHKIDSINYEIENNQYYSVTILKLKQKLERKQKLIPQFKNEFLKLQFTPGIKFPNNKAYIVFDFTIGKFSNIVKLGGQQTKYLLINQPANPIVSKDFLIKMGFKENKLINISFKDQAKKLEKERIKAKSAFEIKKDAKEDELSAMVHKKRSEIRKVFYKKWFTILLNGIISFIMFVLLYQYFRILYRKGLVKKTTFEIFYATNMTSIFFRWIALFNVFIGGVLIVYNFFSFMFTYEIKDYYAPVYATVFNTLNTFKTLQNILYPIFTFIFVILSTWLVVLLSEFIFHISNIYHNGFIKSHSYYLGDENEKQSNIKH